MCALNKYPEYVSSIIVQFVVLSHIKYKNQTSQYDKIYLISLLPSGNLFENVVVLSFYMHEMTFFSYNPTLTKMLLIPT